MKRLMCLGVLAMLVGCEGSKLELESTKTDLVNVTRERDNLKTQVATLQQQLSSVKTDLAEEKTAEAQAAEKSKPAMASKSGPRNGSAAHQNAHAHKS